MAARATRTLTLWEATVADVRLSAETVGDGTPMLCRVNAKRLRHIVAQIRNTYDDGETNDRDDAQSDRDDAQSDRDDAQSDRADDEPAPADDAAPETREPAEPVETPEVFTRRRLPSTTVYLHLDRETQTWSMDGVGPITRAEAEQLVGHSQVTLKPVIDLAANITYTGYVAPPRLREHTALANAGFCTFPSCDRPARTADYDHIQDFADGGATDARNGHRLCRYHHRAKTFTDWTVQAPAPGTWLWTSPAGRTYLVTNGTTTRLDQHQHRRTNAA